MTAPTPRVRFNWEDAVAQDRDLQRIDKFVKLTISKLPGQPAPRADAGRGSRYHPAPLAVKAEQSTTTTRAPASNGNTNGSNSSGGSTPQLINPRDYLSESSSEVDTREVNPMDELSDFEGGSPHQQQRPQQPEPLQPEPQQQESQVEQDEEEADHSMDVEMEEEEEETACEVCKKSDRESEIILCDDCNAEYHIFCLQPPLSTVPDEEEAWYCPKCRVKYPAASTASVKEEQMRAAAPSEAEGENGTTNTTEAATTDSTQSTAAPDDTPTSATTDNDPTSIPIAQALAGDPEKSNMLLIHACNCDDVKCTDPEFRAFCSHMKRFLRSVCWASHSEKWRAYRLARITAELFAYHAMHCTLPQCNVPLCVKIREEEIV